jgi:hypothetical protein
VRRPHREDRQARHIAKMSGYPKVACRCLSPGGTVSVKDKNEPIRSRRSCPRRADHAQFTVVPTWKDAWSSVMTVSAI